MDLKKVEILILVPKINLLGGIAGYYSAVRPYLPDNIKYFTRGSRGINNKLIRLLIFVFDLFRFNGIIFFYNPVTIVINSSIGHEGLKRDAIFLKLAKRILKKKVIVFFRGWESSFFRNKETPKWFNNAFLKSDKIIVLAKEFKDQLIEAGYLGPIIIETTAFDNRLLAYNPIVSRPAAFFSILFLARIERDKGIYEALKAVKKLQNVRDNVFLDVAGEGSELGNVKSFVESEKINKVFFHGFVRGKTKAELFKTASVFLLPSYHEGMPNSVLEAMAFGLPVLTTKVGGINDFFIEEKMGFFIESHNHESIYMQLLKLIDFPPLCHEIKKYNSEYAMNNFYSDKVANRLIKHFEFE